MLTVSNVRLAVPSQFPPDKEAVANVPFGDKSILKHMAFVTL